jgi:hypothetical protein
LVVVGNKIVSLDKEKNVVLQHKMHAHQQIHKHLLLFIIAQTHAFPSKYTNHIKENENKTLKEIRITIFYLFVVQKNTVKHCVESYFVNFFCKTKMF